MQTHCLQGQYLEFFLSGSKSTIDLFWPGVQGYRRLRLPIQTWQSWPHQPADRSLPCSHLKLVRHTSPAWITTPADPWMGRASATLRHGTHSYSVCHSHSPCQAWHGMAAGPGLCCSHQWGGTHVLSQSELSVCSRGSCARDRNKNLFMLNKQCR